MISKKTKPLRDTLLSALSNLTPFSSKTKGGISAINGNRKYNTQPIVISKDKDFILIHGW